jgi:hypothetical protein
MTALEVYDVNPKLIPTFAHESGVRLEDPGERKRQQDIWRKCADDYATRQSLEPHGIVSVVVAYTIDVQNDKAKLAGMEQLDGGDDELVKCLASANPLMDEWYPAPGAKDGVFRFRSGAIAVPLGNTLLQPPRQ